MFESLMKSYKDMNEIYKRKALIDEMKKIISSLQYACERKGILFNPISSRELLDLDNGEESINDYLEAMFVYIMYLEELLGSYIKKTI